MFTTFPRYQAKVSGSAGHDATANNQTGQIRGALNRDQYLANTIDRGMSEMGAHASAAAISKRLRR